VKGEANMMAEIMRGGPIVCGVSVTLAWFDYKIGDIFADDTGTHDLDHVRAT
jgi:hypothetical protein